MGSSTSSNGSTAVGRGNAGRAGRAEADVGQSQAGKSKMAEIAAEEGSAGSEADVDASGADERHCGLGFLVSLLALSLSLLH